MYPILDFLDPVSAAAAGFGGALGEGVATGVEAGWDGGRCGTPRAAVG